MAIKGLSKIIHELQSSLTSVRSLSEILQDYPNINNTKRSEFLDIIIQEAERMTSIIKQAIAKLQVSEDLEMVFYLYVVDDRNHLVGVLSLRQLIQR